MLCLSGFELYPRWVPLKGDGELQLCQLLASTNERKSELLVVSERFHHYTMKVSKYLFPRMPLIC